MAEPQEQQGHLASATEQNIETVANPERRFLRDKTRLDYIADAIADFSGSIYFVLLHVTWITFWFLINTGHFFGFPKFDPHPFILLAMVVSIEAVLRSAFVLMKQNRMSQRVDQRDHLNLQIDLLAEEEITKILQLQRVICQRLGIDTAERDPNVKEMAETTPLQTLADQLREKLPKEPSA